MSETNQIPESRAGAWADRAFRLYQEARERETPLSDEFWELAHGGMCIYARRAALQFPRLPPDEALDIAGEKLLAWYTEHAQSALTGPSFKSPGHLCNFLATITRHGLVDRWRKYRRERPASAEPLPDAEAACFGGERSGADAVLAAREWAEAVVGCVARLSAPARKAWSLRVFFDWSSAEIADHPDVRSSAAAVDTMLSRGRARVRDCMVKKGLGPEPPVGGRLVHILRAWETRRTTSEPGGSRP